MRRDSVTDNPKQAALKELRVEWLKLSGRMEKARVVQATREVESLSDSGKKSRKKSLRKGKKSASGANDEPDANVSDLTTQIEGVRRQISEMEQSIASEATDLTDDIRISSAGVVLLPLEQARDEAETAGNDIRCALPKPKKV